MQKDFHYYAAYCAAYLAGYTAEESAQIAFSDQFADCCTVTLLKKLGAPLSAATTQSSGELINARTDVIGRQDITRIWASFHFLPRDLYAEIPRGSKMYKNKYRLICGPNGDLLVKTVKLAEHSSLESVGLAMHILSDTWAHTNFAGTPSQVINDVSFEVDEIIRDGETETARPIHFRHSTGGDDLENGLYTCSVNNTTENSIMILGHGRAGHLPDYSFMTYRYMPAWGNYECIVKDNPADYMKAFRQMVTALRFLHGDTEDFQVDTYDLDAVEPWAEKIDAILRKRQLDSCDDWEALGEEITGQKLVPFDTGEWEKEYQKAGKKEKDDTALGRFALAALRQKSMITREIFVSGNLLAGFSKDYDKVGFAGIRDFRKLVQNRKEN